MTVRKVILGLVVIVFGILSYATSRAQNTTSATPVNKNVSLEINTAYIPCENPTATAANSAPPPCIAYPTDISTHPDPSHIDHELGLSAQNLPPNTDVIIVGCITTAAGARCTSGDANLDAQLNSAAGGDRMNPDPSYQFKALENPVKTTDTGTLEDVIVRSYTPQITSHFFRGYYVSTDNTTTTTPSVSPSQPSITPAGQQQGQVTFPPSPPPQIRAN